MSPATRDLPFRLTSVSFYLLIPGFFLYHFLLAKQLIPGVLGGYSTAMATLLLLPLGMAFLQRMLGNPAERCAMDLFFGAFVAFYAVVLLLNMALTGRGSAASEQFGIVPQFLTLYFLARLLPLGQARLQRWLLPTLILMSAAIVTNADEGTFFAASLDILGTVDYLANYQAYAFMYTIVMLILLAPIRKRWLRAMVYLFALPTLFLNGARTEFIGMLLLVLLLEFILSRHKLLTLMAAASLVGAAYASLPLLAELYPESRTVLLFIDASDDISANERARMLAGGLHALVTSPWIGSLGSHAPGEHIHNALSAWVDLGVIGFAWYVLLIAVPALDLFVLRRPQLQNPSYRLTFSLLFLMALFAITAKHFTHQLLPLALGIYARHVVHERHRETHPSPAANSRSFAQG